MVALLGFGEHLGILLVHGRKRGDRRDAGFIIYRLLFVRRGSLVVSYVKGDRDASVGCVIYRSYTYIYVYIYIHYVYGLLSTKRRDFLLFRFHMLPPKN